ncbi:hypothetical protein J6590_010741 [Homalodisca vitripennis]|nr:hypothetical protein J6590_010741 [Homalodisca vitripennis]
MTTSQIFRQRVTHRGNNVQCRRYKARRADVLNNGQSPDYKRPISWRDEEANLITNYSKRELGSIVVMMTSQPSNRSHLYKLFCHPRPSGVTPLKEILADPHIRQHLSQVDCKFPESQLSEVIKETGNVVIPTVSHSPSKAGKTEDEVARAVSVQVSSKIPDITQ